MISIQSQTLNILYTLTQIIHWAIGLVLISTLTVSNAQAAPQTPLRAERNF